MQLDLGFRLALVVGGVIVIAVALAGAAWGALDNGLVQQVVTIAGGLLAGLGLAGGPSKGAGAAGLLLAFALVAGGCNGQHPTAADCTVEGRVVEGLGQGIDAAARIAGDRGGERFDEAIRYARGAQLLGQFAVGACRNLRDGAGWQVWVGTALEAAGAVASFFGAAGPEDLPDAPPPALTSAITQLQAQQ